MCFPSPPEGNQRQASAFSLKIPRAFSTMADRKFFHLSLSNPSAILTFLRDPQPALSSIHPLPLGLRRWCRTGSGPSSSFLGGREPIPPLPSTRAHLVCESLISAFGVCQLLFPLSNSGQKWGWGTMGEPCESQRRGPTAGAQKTEEVRVTSQ